MISKMKCPTCGTEMVDHGNCYKHANSYNELVVLAKHVAKLSCNQEIGKDCLACKAKDVLIKLGESYGN